MLVTFQVSVWKIKNGVICIRVPTLKVKTFLIVKSFVYNFEYFNNYLDIARLQRNID